MDCYCHKLNLCLDSAFETTGVSALLQKVRTVVNHFRRSPKATLKLLEAQRSLKPEVEAVHIISDSKTRWASTYYMLQRFLRLRPALQQLLPLKTLDVVLLIKDWECIAEVIKILDPVAEAITTLEGDKYPTLTFVVEIVQLLTQHPQKFKYIEPRAEEFGEARLSDLSRRCNLEDMPEAVYLATILDPNLKNYTVPTGKKKDTWALLEAQYKRLATNLSAQVEQKESIEESDDTTSLAKLRKQMVNKTPVQSEIKRYKAVDTPSMPALEWWKVNQIHFPVLYHLARKYLAIPASSAPVERLFSTAGNVITKNRQRLKPETARALFCCIKIRSCRYSDYSK